MLTDKALKALKPRERAYKRADGKGLFVIVRPDGALWWRFKYRFAGREKLISLGVYPDVSLKRAREKRDEARKLLDKRIDPSAKRRADKLAQADTFKAAAEEWLKLGCPSGKSRKGNVSAGTIERTRQRLERYIFPYLGRDPVGSIGAPDLLRVLRRIEARGNHETAHRTRAACSRIFRFAIATGRADRDPAADLIGALTPPSVRSYAALTEPKSVGALLRAIDGYQGQPAVVAALKLAPLVFVRPGELRLATWGELDLDGAVWRIPPERMKMGREHLVPLSSQAVAVLEELQPITDRGPGSWIFAGLRVGRPISENTLNVALRAMGYDTGTQHCAHGFRSTASTLLHEMGWDSDVIECQLAHSRPGVGGIYNRSHRLTERKRMMQAWADYLGGLKAGGQVTAIPSPARRGRRVEGRAEKER